MICLRFKAGANPYRRSYKFNCMSGFFIIVCSRNEKIDPVLCIAACHHFFFRR